MRPALPKVAPLGQPWLGRPRSASFIETIVLPREDWERWARASALYGRSTQVRHSSGGVDTLSFPRTKDGDRRRTGPPKAVIPRLSGGPCGPSTAPPPDAIEYPAQPRAEHRSFV